MAFQEIPNKIDLVGQTASIGTSNLMRVGPLGKGMYAIWADVLVTTPGATGTVVITIAWNNGSTSASLVSAPFSLAAAGEQAALLGNFFSIANSPITYATTVSGATGNPVYNLTLRLQYLG